MRSPRNIHILICVVLFASYRKCQARTVTKLLYDKPNAHRNTVNKVSSKLYTDDSHSPLHGATNCVKLGLRNMICIYNEGRLTDLPVYSDESFSNEHYTHWPDFEEKPEELEEFVDLTRQNRDYSNIHGVGRSQFDMDSSFSEDYLDIGDLSFTRKVTTADQHLPRTYRELIALLLKAAKEKRFNRRFFSFPDARILNFLSPKLIPKNNVQEKEHSDKEDTSAEEEDDSDDSDDKPKRFEVIEHSESSESEEVPKEVPEKKKVPKKKKVQKNLESKYVYMQGPMRLLYPDGRRRLPHFLPKRIHWSQDDIRKLPYLWFNGPQGQYAGIFRNPM